MSKISTRIGKIENSADMFKPAPHGTPARRMTDAQIVYALTGGKRTSLTEQERGSLSGAFVSGGEDGLRDWHRKLTQRTKPTPRLILGRRRLPPSM